jgi:general secretion pathway protein A
MIQQFHRYLIDEYSQGRNIAIIIDEAQNTPVQTLENLRMLSNLETTEDKLVQIVLVGQPEMEDKLNRYELRQLKQRIAVRATIQCLTPEECKEYMLYRLGSVTPEENQVITHKAMDLIIEKSQGIPRVINVLCDNALISGFGYMKNPVTPQIVKEVIRDYEGRSAPKGWRRWGRVLLYLLIFGLIGAGAAAAIYYFFPGLLGK